MNKYRGILGYTTLILATLIVYAPALRGQFVWDDDAFLTGNPLIKAPDGLYRFWFTTDPPDYFPLTSSMLWVEWRLWGRNPAGYHVVNVLLHAISAVLVWRVLKRLHVPGAWLTGLIFGIHPVNVESVAWITERKNTLPMMLNLAAILFYLHFENRQRKPWYALALILFLLAMLGKTSVVTLPFVLLIIAWWQRGRIARKDVLRTIPFFCLAIALGLVTWWFQYNRSIALEIVRTDGFPARLAGAGWAVWFYLYKAVIPNKLTFVYPRWQIDPSSVVSYLPGAALLGCFILFWQYRRSWGRPLLVGLGYYVVTLLPVLGFLNIYFMRYSLVADHWQYTSIVGAIAMLVGLVAAIINRKPQAFRAPAMGIAIVVVGIMSFLTWRQASIYKNNETLWLDTLAKNPSAWLAHNNLGVLLMERNDLDHAEKHLAQSLKYNPSYVLAHNNMGSLLARRGNISAAAKHFSQAIHLQPNYAPAHKNLGNMLLSENRLEEAAACYHDALNLKPDWPEPANNLAWILATHPNATVRNGNEAVRLAEAACKAGNYENWSYMSTLAAAYAEGGNFHRAVQTAEKALAIAVSQSNRLAIKDLKTAIELYRKGKPSRITAASKPM